MKICNIDTNVNLVNEKALKYMVLIFTITILCLGFFWFSVEPFTLGQNN